jgi:hypothetical protein
MKSESVSNLVSVLILWLELVREQVPQSDFYLLCMLPIIATILLSLVLFQRRS